MPKKAAHKSYSGGTVPIQTADKTKLVSLPQQAHNLSFGPNRVVLLTAPPNRGKSLCCLQIAARSAPFHKVYVYMKVRCAAAAVRTPMRHNTQSRYLNGNIVSVCRCECAVGPATAHSPRARGATHHTGFPGVSGRFFGEFGRKFGKLPSALKSSICVPQPILSGSTFVRRSSEDFVLQHSGFKRL